MRTGNTFSIGCGECEKRFIGGTILHPLSVEFIAEKEDMFRSIGEFIVGMQGLVTGEIALHTSLFHPCRLEPNIQLFRED